MKRLHKFVNLYNQQVLLQLIYLQNCHEGLFPYCLNTLLSASGQLCDRLQSYLNLALLKAQKTETNDPDT